MKKVKMICLGLLTLTITACTENSRVKSFGGEATLNLPKGRKLVNITWKEDNLWYLTKSMTADDIAETYKFHEESSYGMMEGTYKIVETK